MNSNVKLIENKLWLSKSETYLGISIGVRLKAGRPEGPGSAAPAGPPASENNKRCFDPYSQVKSNNVKCFNISKKNSSCSTRVE